eukprot:6185882-Pleurochrysis_carterae.AAC.1
MPLALCPVSHRASAGRCAAALHGCTTTGSQLRTNTCAISQHLLLATWPPALYPEAFPRPPP